MKKINVIVYAILIAVSLTSCGKYTKLYETLDAMTLETVFPEVNSEAGTIDEAQEAVLAQQKALCEAMSEAYDLTNVEILREKHPEINRNKMMSALSNKRQEMNNDSTKIFLENMKSLLANVDNDEKNTYITQCLEEVRLFYRDYYTLLNADDENFGAVSNVLLNYAFSDNELAKSVLHENMDLVIEAAALTIEKNANTDSSFRANITKNNSIIRALNELFRGVTLDKEYKDRINSANKALLVKTLDSMSSMSQAERDAILSQFEAA